VLFGVVVAVVVAVDAAAACGAGLAVALRGIGKRRDKKSHTILSMCLCLAQASRPESDYVDRAGEAVKFVLFSLTAALLCIKIGSAVALPKRRISKFVLF
jgi:hypothetical protein